VICVDRYGRNKAEGDRLQIEMTERLEGLAGRVTFRVYMNVRPRGDDSGKYTWDAFGGEMQLREFFLQLGITKEDCARVFEE